MDRRRFLLAAGGATAGGLAGCLGSGGSNGPEDVLEAFFAATVERDWERAEELGRKHSA